MLTLDLIELDDGVTSLSNVEPNSVTLTQLSTRMAKELGMPQADMAVIIELFSKYVEEEVIAGKRVQVGKIGFVNFRWTDVKYYDMFRKKWVHNELRPQPTFKFSDGFRSRLRAQLVPKKEENEN